MIAFIIIGIVLIILYALMYLIFRLAFVRENMEELNDVNSPHNDFLDKYRPQVAEGMKFIDRTPHDYVFTKSFDGLKLAARYYKNNDSDRTIILVHGYRSVARRDFACVVEIYYNLGFNILLVDQRCSGRSEGKIITFGIKESRDVVSWLDFLTTQYGEKDFYLDGISMGATTVLLATRFELKNVKGIIADCGFTSPAEIIGIVAKRKFKISDKLAVPVLNFLSKLFGGFDLLEFSTTEVLKTNTIPLLFLHGKADGLVPYYMTEKSYAAATAPKDMLLVEDADHGMSFFTDNEGVLKKLKEFLGNNS